MPSALVIFRQSLHLSTRVLTYFLAVNALLCEFDYPGNIRSLRNLVYELRSYLDDNESISVRLVQAALARLRSREGLPLTKSNSERSVLSNHIGDSTTPVLDLSSVVSEDHQSLLCSIACEVDIILPLELCVLRREETFKQWTARAKRCTIEAARQSTGGTMQTVAERLGLSRCSLKSHLHRAKRAQDKALFNGRREHTKE